MKHKNIAAAAISAVMGLMSLAISAKESYIGTDSTVVVRDYIANMEYVNGVLERVNFEGGYIDMTGESPKYMFYETDHLGNVRAVVDEDGNVCQVNHYYPYGDRFEDTRDIPAEESDNTKLFGGKEYSEDTDLHDFEARYDNTLFGRFTTLDPMAEKYYSVSPYAYCAGNPVRFVDPNGQETYVRDNNDSTYTVTGGKLNMNHRIYVVDSNNEFIRNERGRRISIGKSMTPVSFYNFVDEKWMDATIDLKNKQGQTFIKDLIADMLPLGVYMESAKEYNINDFKHTDGINDLIREDVLRGMPVTIGGVTYFASARDIGNYVAGYYAGANGFNWLASRIAFDVYQKGVEGLQTQIPQFMGWKYGFMQSPIVKNYNLLKSIPSLLDFCRKWFIE